MRFLSDGKALSPLITPLPDTDGGYHSGKDHFHQHIEHGFPVHPEVKGGSLDGFAGVMKSRPELPLLDHSAGNFVLPYGNAAGQLPPIPEAEVPVDGPGGKNGLLQHLDPALSGPDPAGVDAVGTENLAEVADQTVLRVQDMERPVPHGHLVVPGGEPGEQTGPEHGRAGRDEMGRDHVPQVEERL